MIGGTANPGNKRKFEARVKWFSGRHWGQGAGFFSCLGGRLNGGRKLAAPKGAPAPPLHFFSGRRGGRLGPAPHMV